MQIWEFGLIRAKDKIKSYEYIFKTIPLETR